MNCLRLIGFDVDQQLRETYRRRFPDDHGATDLRRWRAIEEENPDAFAEMYQFWIQKGD